MCVKTSKDKVPITVYEYMWRIKTLFFLYVRINFTLNSISLGAFEIYWG